MATWTLTKNSGAPSGTIKVNVANGQFVIDDASNPSIITNDAQVAGELLTMPYLQLSGLAGITDHIPSLKDVVLVDGVLSTPAFGGGWTPIQITPETLFAVNVKDDAYGAFGNVREARGAVSGASNNQLTLTGVSFTTADIGAKVIILNTGAIVNNGVTMLGCPLVTTITGVSSGVATIAAAATSVTPAGTTVRVIWGKDDSAAIAAAAAVARALGQPLLFPSGGFFAHSIFADIRGAGSTLSTVYRLPDMQVGAVNYALGNYLPLAGNPQTQAPTGTPDKYYSAADITLDGLVDPENADAWNGLQGSGFELYGLLRGSTHDLHVQNFAYSGVEVGANRPGSEKNDGAANSGIENETGNSGANQKEPMPTMNIDMSARTEATNCGMQWGAFGAIDVGYKTTGALSIGDTHIGVQTNVGGTPDLSRMFPGQRIAIGSAGIYPGETPTNGSREVVCIDKVDIVANVIYFTQTPVTLNHASTTPIGAVNYWGDPGFGIIVREPARDISIENPIADMCAWGGWSMGQTQNYKYQPFNCRNIHVGRLRVTRCGIQGAPLVKLGFFEDLSIDSGYIGDPGGRLYGAAQVGDKVLTLRMSEGRRFINNEQIWVGLTGAAQESNRVARVVTWHTGTANVTGGSTTLTSVVGTWVVGEKIQGNNFLAGTRVTGPGAQGTVLTNPGSMTISQAAISNFTAMPIQGGDSIVLTTALANNHPVGEHVFFYQVSSPGVAVQEVGYTLAHGAKLSNLEIEHCDNGVEFTTRDALAPAGAPTLTPSASGGTLPAGTYNYRIAASDGGPLSLGPEATASVTTTGTTSSIAISWAAVPGANSYTVYGRTPGQELLLKSLGNVLTYTDTNADVPANTAPGVPTLTPSTTGGTIPAGTYNYRIGAIVGGVLAVGPEAAVSVTTTGATSSIVVTWAAVTGATGYNVYGRTPGGELLLKSLGNVLTYTDTYADYPAGTVPGALPVARTIDNRRHSLSNIHSHHNLHAGFSHTDSQDVTHTGCIAEGNGTNGFVSISAAGILANHVYSGCDAYNNGSTDWNLVAGSYVAQACLGLLNTGEFEAVFGNGSATSFVITPYTKRKYPNVIVVNLSTGEIEDVSVTYGAATKNATGLWQQSITIAGWSVAPASNSYQVTVN